MPVFSDKGALESEYMNLMLHLHYAHTVQYQGNKIIYPQLFLPKGACEGIYEMFECSSE